MPMLSSPMSKRSMVIGLALLAVIAVTIMVALNAAALDEKDLGDPVALVTVIVATEDIPVARQLNPLIRHGVVVEVQIPRYALIDGAATDLARLDGMKTATVIRKREQVWLSSLTGDFHVVTESATSSGA
jgi:hypothetical protein